MNVTNGARIAGLIAVVALSMFGAGRKPYSPREKAFYADASTVQFVRPGLTITINSAQIASDGTISVKYTVTDPSGSPLDVSGVTTPGAISLNSIAAVLSNSNDYTTYTTRSTTGAAATAIEPSRDSGGTTTNLGSGQYQICV